MKAKLNEIIVKHTGQPIERVEKDTDRDYFMGAQRGEGVRHRSTRWSSVNRKSAPSRARRGGADC